MLHEGVSGGHRVPLTEGDAQAPHQHKNAHSTHMLSRPGPHPLPCPCRACAAQQVAAKTEESLHLTLQPARKDDQLAAVGRTVPSGWAHSQQSHKPSN